jgi:hypothetical protein
MVVLSGFVFILLQGGPVSAGTAIIHVQWKQNRLSLAVQDAPLAEVLAAITSETEMSIECIEGCRETFL